MKCHSKKYDAVLGLASEYKSESVPLRKIVPIILWLLVAACGAVVAWQATRKPDVASSNANTDQSEVPGAVFENVPWEHLPDIDQFELVDQNGDPFDSAEMMGTPYAVSFFFATCPSICRDLNAQVSRLNEQTSKEPIAFVSISVDPDNDTPEILNRYAQDYGAQAPRWSFLTGPKHKVVEIGAQQFNVDITPATHTGNILLVDKWGRYRDRFKWDDPYDMKRFLEVAAQAADETEPPFGKTITTRNALAGKAPIDLNVIPWLHDFHLTDQEGQPFCSRQLTGDVWIANFFFVDCPGICVQQNNYLLKLQKRLSERFTENTPAIVSITSNPASDTPERLKDYAKKIGASTDSWKFLTSESNTLIKRIGTEFFGVSADKENHSSLLFVVDRWSNLRGKFDWQKDGQEEAMLALIEKLQQETAPTGATLR